MGSQQTKSAPSTPVPATSAPPSPTQQGEEKKLKPCCACPETKRARDECIILNGEEQCGEFIEAHKKCMRSYGFNV